MMRVVAGQLAAAVTVAIVLGGLWGSHAGYSALVGALIGVVPNYFLALRLARRHRSVAAEHLLRGVYVGALIKIVFTAAMFVIAIAALNVNFLIVLATYIATVAVSWLAVLLGDLGEAPRAGRGAPHRAGCANVADKTDNGDEQTDHGSRNTC